MTADGSRGVLLCGVGAPGSLAEVDDFVRGLRGNRPTPPELLEEMRLRYERIGGASPLGAISRKQAAALEEHFRSRGANVPCRYGAVVGVPSLASALKELRAEGVRDLTCVALTPYYSGWGVGRYFREVRRLVRSFGNPARVRFVTSWHLEPGLVSAFADAVEQARRQLAPAGAGDPLVVFTAHSLPTRLLGPREPYLRLLGETRRAVAVELSLQSWISAFQSVGRSEGPWLGPAVEALVESLVPEPERGVIVLPYGFIADNLEILYDLDIDLAEAARRRGIPFARAPVPNLNPRLIEAMARAAGGTPRRE